MNRRLLLLLAATTLFAADYAAEGKLWWAHIQFLADDRLEGRNPGTQGFDEALRYVEGQFEKLGPKPAGTSRYLHPINFQSRTLLDPSLELIRGGKSEAVALGQEATLGSRGDVPPLAEV